jgi:hypothetical protein
MGPVWLVDTAVIICREVVGRISYIEVIDSLFPWHRACDGICLDALALAVLSGFQSATRAACCRMLARVVDTGAGTARKLSAGFFLTSVSAITSGRGSDPPPRRPVEWFRYFVSDYCSRPGASGGSY